MKILKMKLDDCYMNSSKNFISVQLRKLNIFAISVEKDERILSIPFWMLRQYYRLENDIDFLFLHTGLTTTNFLLVLIKIWSNRKPRNYVHKYNLMKSEFFFFSVIFIDKEKEKMKNDIKTQCLRFILFIHSNRKSFCLLKYITIIKFSLA